MKRLLAFVILCMTAVAVSGQNLRPEKASNGKWGFVNTDGKQVVDFIYDYAEPFRGGFAKVTINNRCGFVNAEGRQIAACKYDNVYDFKNGFANVRLNGKLGVIDTAGRQITECKYDWIGDYNEENGLASVVIDGKYGMIDTAGRQIVECRYGWNIKVYDGVVIVSVNGKYGIVNTDGKQIADCKYDWIGDFKDGLANVEMNGKTGLIDMAGEQIADCIYDAIFIFRDGFANVKSDGKYGAINADGKLVAECIYDYNFEFSDGFAKVCQNGKYGLINTEGKVVIPCRYDRVYDIHDGLIRVLVNKSYYYKDTQGKTVSGPYYFHATDFEGGIAEVNVNGKMYYINKIGRRFDTADECRMSQLPFSEYAKLYVEKRINDWQKKGEFETTADWQARVNQQTRSRKIEELTREAEREFIADRSNGLNLEYTLGRYDADNQVFLIECNGKEMLVPVPGKDAQTFKEMWGVITKTPKYFVEDDQLGIAEVTFALSRKKQYKYSNTASLNYTVAQVDYNFDPIEIVMADGDGGKGGSQNISTVNISVGKADVDVDIPSGRISNAASTFAVIIANENYQRESKVEFARNDGETFRKYCTTTLGLPEKNVHYVADATLNNMRAEIDWVCRVAKTYGGSADIIFYYAGHGIPDESTRASYLLPVDGYGYNVSTGYKLSDLYDRLGSVPAGSVTVFLDACFSGTARDGMMMASARGVAIKARADAPTGKMVVFSAAQGDETAYPYREKGHGLFTYYLLKKLQQTKGNVTYGELGDYITEQVGRTAIVENSKPQTPTVTVAPALAQTWKSLEF